jgi:ribosomal protein S8E
LSHPDFHKNIKKKWVKHCGDRNALGKIQQNLKLCKQYRKGWG